MIRIVVAVIIRGIRIVGIIRRMPVVSIVNTSATVKWIVIIPIVIRVKTSIIIRVVHWPMESSYS
jgi:hypothetical protein